MFLSDLYKETSLAIRSNRARSSLTILGIVIGIGSVISMVSIGQGAQKSIESSIESMGSNLLIIMPGMKRNAVGTGGVSAGRGSAQTLTLEDAEAIKDEVSDVKEISPELSSRYQVVYKNNNTNTQIVGTVSQYPDVRSLTVESGSFFTIQDVKNANRVAVIAPDTRDDLFGEGVDPIGETIKINNMQFKIIGLTESKGGTGMGSQDDMIFIPISVAKRYLAGNSYISNVYVQAVDEESLTNIQSDVTELLLKRHKISDEASADFQIMNQSDVVEAASSVTGTFTMLLGAIAGISLVVGGIGIMNMMLTTVTERTREIGLRKAIGAKRNDISNQFLAESVMLTFIGGILGVVLGWTISKIITSFADIATTISFSSVLLAFGVSAAIGIIFGYYPAKRAAKLNPIEALRYE
jgi:putative ABC transport system permease protein